MSELDRTGRCQRRLLLQSTSASLSGKPLVFIIRHHVDSSYLRPCRPVSADSACVVRLTLLLGAGEKEDCSGKLQRVYAVCGPHICVSEPGVCWISLGCLPHASAKSRPADRERNSCSGCLLGPGPSKWVLSLLCDGIPAAAIILLPGPFLETQHQRSVKSDPGSNAA